jgi:cytochrome c biogenesis protein
VAADKGLAREAGSLLFHWAFLLILVGIVWGKGTGFTGQAVIVEGQTWTEAHASYDGQIREGRFFGEDHSGIRITLRRFVASYRIPSGVPRDFVSTVALADADGTSEGTREVRVNHPAELDGVKIYQFGYGWAPVIRVVRDGEPLVSGPTVCSQGPPPEGASPLQLPWNCVVKLPSLRPQVGIRFLLWPDIRGLDSLMTGGQAMPMLGANSPFMTFTAYEGDLRSDLALPSNDLDTTGMRVLLRGGVGEGNSVDLGGGVRVTFADLRRYSVLEIKRDRGLGILLAAAILILVGLLPALYTSRRKVWVTAEPAPGGTGSVVKVGGFALQRRPQFEEEFARLVEAIAPRVGGEPGHGRDRSGAEDREEVRT